MLLDPSLYERLVMHFRRVIDDTLAEENPFPHVVLRGIFPEEIFQRLLDCFPPEECFVRANPKHHSNEYGGSTRQRMSLNEGSFQRLPESHQSLWATVRAAIACEQVRESLFQKLSSGLCRRFRIDKDELLQIPAFPRGQFYSETEGYRIAPHPDTRDKIVTMQFAFAHDSKLCDMGTEFYARSFNPIHYLREPNGFVTVKTMPFLPNHAYAFSVLNDVGLKSWHGRCTMPQSGLERKTLLHIWYAEADETDSELDEYRKFLESPGIFRKCA